MTTLIVLTVIDIALLIAGLAIYLFIVGGQLTKVAPRARPWGPAALDCSRASVTGPLIDHRSSPTSLSRGRVRW